MSIQAGRCIRPLQVSRQLLSGLLMKSCLDTPSEPVYAFECPFECPILQEAYLQVGILRMRPV